MIIHNRIVTEPLINGGSAKKMLEKFYVQNCFENHLNSISRPERRFLNSPNYEYYVTAQVVDYIDELFTLPQLYCIFNACNYELGCWGLDYTTMNEFKSFAINFINEEDEYENDLGDIENFKKNVMELNPIVFTILNDLFNESHMFDDDYWSGYRYPKISEDESECSNELKELIWTYGALEKIKGICNSSVNIDDRVAALINEGFDIKLCRVGSGGLNSTFYLYNKREIRIQIVACKFKGKSKSALCVVIPYPTFLHKNCVRVKY